MIQSSPAKAPFSHEERGGWVEHSNFTDAASEARSPFFTDEVEQDHRAGRHGL